MSNYLEREFLEEHESLIKNCYIGFGIIITEDEEGNGVISVDPNPIKNLRDGKELREFMLKIALS